VGYGNIELRFPLIDYLILPFAGLRDIRGRVFFDVGGAALANQNFQFWTTSGRDLRPAGTNLCTGTSGPCLVNGVSSFGVGFELNLLGLPLHWDFARLWDLKHTLSSFKTAFYIGPSF